MKAVRFFPLAFIANVHGFILFAIYVILFLSVAMIVQMFQPQSIDSKTTGL